jgi:outer membrane protein assembly factor BamB
MIYTAGDIEDDTVITAMDLDGRILWRARNGRAWKGSQPGSRGTPTIDGGRLYHESPHGDLVCLDAATGERTWAVNILEAFHSENIDWALAESPLVDGDRVICCPGGPETAVVALDKATGRIVWKSPSTGDLAGYASAVLAEFQGVRMILTLTSRAAIAVHADTGELLWRFEHRTPFNENITRPLYHEGHVFLSTRTTGSVLLKLQVRGNRVRVTPAWQSTELDNQHGGVILLDGYIYGSSHVRNNAQWICLDWKTGRPTYVKRGVGKGSLTYADGMLYTLAERGGRVGLVPATPEGHHVVSEFRIPDRGDGPTWAHPVVCGGRLYVRHSGFLYAYDIRAGQ